MSLFVFYGFSELLCESLLKHCSSQCASRDSITYTMSVLETSLGVASVTWLFQTISVPPGLGKNCLAAGNCLFTSELKFDSCSICCSSWWLVFEGRGGEGSVWELQGSYSKVKEAALSLKILFSSLHRLKCRLKCRVTKPWNIVSVIVISKSELQHLKGFVDEMSRLFWQL